MTLQEAMAQLESLGHPKLREQNHRNGAPDNQFGVRMGDIRTLAKSIKTDHDLALQLWETGQVEAQLLAILIMRPKYLSEDQLEAMVASVTWSQVADWLTSYVVKPHPARESLRQRWIHSDHPWLARAPWSLTADRISKEPEGLDLAALLDRIEAEMAEAPEPARWTMNFYLAGIGIDFAERRARALDIGERIGAYRDYPCAKGCTSPFAPIWINEMVSRQA